MEPLVRDSKVGFLGWVFFWVPTLRFFKEFVRASEEGRYGELYFRDGARTTVRDAYGWHMEYLERVVPRDKLRLYRVEEEWGPLCEILGKDVPDEAFPRVNDGKVVEEFFREKVVEGLVRWVGFGGVVAVVAGVLMYFLRS